MSSASRPPVQRRHSSYPAAAAAASMLHAWFVEACDYAAPGEARATVPDEGTIEVILSAGFWASLEREEGRSPRISLAFLSPDETSHPLRFARALPVTPRTLTRIAPAVERPGIHVGVWQEDGRLALWGTCTSIPPACFVLEVVQPGLLVVKARRGLEGAKFANVAALHGDQIRIIDEVDDDAPEFPPHAASLIGIPSRDGWRDPVNGIVQLAASMRAHGRGGALLIVPSDSDEWRESIAHPMSYAVTPPFAELQQALERPASAHDALWRETMQRAVDLVAGLTAVDGATILDDRFRLIGFGAKIVRSPRGAPLDKVQILEPVLDTRPYQVSATDLGGTRHMSAAQFVHDQRDALALVASQDGRFTVFAWRPDEEMVHAHRVEVLLL